LVVILRSPIIHFNIPGQVKYPISISLAVAMLIAVLMHCACQKETALSHKEFMNIMSGEWKVLAYRNGCGYWGDCDTTYQLSNFQLSGNNIDTVYMNFDCNGS